MPVAKLDRELYVAGDASDHVGFLNCEQIAERSHIHGWKVDAHYHEGLSQLLIFDRGEVDSEINSQHQIISGPAMAWLPALCSHAFDYQKGMRGWVLTVPTSDISQMAQGSVWLEHWIDQAQVLQGEKHYSLLSQAINLAKQIEYEHQSVSEERNAVLESLFLLLLVNLHRGLEVDAGSKTQVTDRRQTLLKQFQNKLDQHLQSTRSVADYAEMLSVTPTHLSRSIKVVSGKTAGEIIHDRLLLEAKRQLVFTDIPVSEIAYALKFSSPSYFTRFFTAQTDDTPKAFRSRARRSVGKLKASNRKIQS